jgi:protein-L-isoaspartate O-methyltransferase
MIQIGPADAPGGGLTNAKMVDRLKRSGTLTDPAVEKALLVIPRGEFVTDDLHDVAYIGSQSS